MHNALEAAKAKRLRRQEKLRNLANPKPQEAGPFWNEYLDESWLAEVKASHRRDARVWREVRGLVRPRVVRDIEAYMEDCDMNSGLAIVSTPCGTRQDESEYAFGHAFIDQYCNGGWSGDDFAGQVCIPLNAGKYLQFHYSC